MFRERQDLALRLLEPSRPRGLKGHLEVVRILKAHERKNADVVETDLGSDVVEMKIQTDTIETQAHKGLAETEGGQGMLIPANPKRFSGRYSESAKLNLK